MFESHAADQRAIGQEGQVHGGKCQQRMHHIGSGGSDLDQAGNTKSVSG